jgi:TatD DNase family protein
MNLYDAHNHVHEEVFADGLDSVLAAVRSENVRSMVVNGSSEEDWEAVLSVAAKAPEAIPSFGYHPWYVEKRSAEWQKQLEQSLDRTPSCIGEIGLDRWLDGVDFPQQVEVFGWQLRLAADRNLPASIHCLKAWGKMLEMLRAGPTPSCGFILHSYGGPVEMIQPLAKVGAYFSLPGYFANERKVRQREAFRLVPPDRLLIETDAPDQLLPEERVLYRLSNKKGQPVNHPANIIRVYEFAAELLQLSIEELAARVEENFLCLFGRTILRQKDRGTVPQSTQIS